MFKRDKRDKQDKRIKRDKRFKKRILLFAALAVFVVFAGVGCGLYSLLTAPLGTTLVEPTPNIQPRLRLPYDVYWKGGLVQVAFFAPPHFTDKAWVGMFRAEAPHGTALENADIALDYRFLEGQVEGVLEFAAPMSLGSYELRMYNGGGDAVDAAIAAFRVSDVGMEHVLQAEMQVDHHNYLKGEPILVFFTASPSVTESGWIGLIPSTVGHGDEALNDREAIEKQYVQGREAGIMVFTAPDFFAEYDLRYHESDDNGSEVYFVTIKVVDY